MRELHRCRRDLVKANQFFVSETSSPLIRLLLAGYFSINDSVETYERDTLIAEHERRDPTHNGQLSRWTKSAKTHATLITATKAIGLISKLCTSHYTSPSPSTVHVNNTTEMSRRNDRRFPISTPGRVPRPPEPPNTNASNTSNIDGEDSPALFPRSSSRQNS